MVASLSVVHLGLLVALTYLTTKRLFSGLPAQFAAGFLLVWINLVYTGLTLACISRLNSVTLYFLTSLSLASALFYAIYRRGAEVQPMRLVDDFDAESWGKWRRATVYFLGLTLALAALGTLIICLRYYANNWDTVAYRFARVFFYLGQGNLLHFGAGIDPRSVFYPINGTLAYMFLAIYQWGGHAFNLVSFLCWAASGIGVFLFSRVLGASRFGGFVSAWFCLMAPIVLCVAASTNDEILAAAPTVVGVLFLARALRDWSRRCLVIGIAGIGLGFGVKLHWLFFGPFLAIGALVVAVALLRSKEAQRIWRKRLPELALASCLAAPLVFSFAVCNLISSGEVTAVAFMKDAVNTPFRFDVAVQKIRINTTQLFLAPLPDLEVHFDAGARRLPYDRFNKWMNELWFKDVNQGKEFLVYPYRFQGVADPMGFNYFEQTLWLGFLPVFMVLVIVNGLVRRNISGIALATCSLLFLWHFSYAAQTKYAEAISTYYSYPAILACAGLGLMVDRMRWQDNAINKILIVIGAGVVVTHLIFDFNLLAFNVQRNVPQALAKGFDGESSVTRSSPRVTEAIRGSSRIHIPYQHWELLFWTYMRQNPGARYSTGAPPAPAEPDTLYLLSLEAGSATGKLIGRRPAGRSSGVVFLGTSASGFENVFAHGAGVEKKYPGDANYFVVPVTFLRRPDTETIAKIQIDASAVVGLQPVDEVEFRVVADCLDGTRQTGKWMTPSVGSDEIVFSPTQVAAKVAVEARVVTQPNTTCVLVSDLPSLVRPDRHVCSGTGGGELKIMLPTTAPGQESTKWSGRDYLVRWLGQRTEFTVHNPGTADKAEIRLELGINKNPKSAIVTHSGGKTAPIKVEKLLWAQGPQSVNFTVPLKPGENRMVLSTLEPADPLSDGRPGALLLIGDITASTESAPREAIVRRTTMNCYCGRTEVSATAAYRSLQLDGGKAIAGLFDKNQLVELEGHAPAEVLGGSGSLSKIHVTSGKLAGTLCWLPSTLLE